MHVQNVRPGTGRPVIAYFDLDLVDGEVRINNLYLKRNGAGKLRVYAPTPGDKRIVTFSGAFGDKIIRAAEMAMGGRLANASSY